jgi:hypothetical protein
MVSIWLDRRPQYRRHFTLSEEGVRYRTGLLRKEQAFDWEEVDRVDLQEHIALFLLKNEERHEVSLKSDENDTEWQRQADQLKTLVQQKRIELKS